MLSTFLSSLFGFIFLNIPIAFSLILTTIVLMVFAGELSSANIASSVYRGIDNFPLMAIPFFMLAGEIMNVGGMSRRIVNFANALVGHVTGGLGYVSVVASMIFAGVSGSAVADTSAIGSILLPIMKKEGYDVPKSTALIASAGTIGPIIPPSIPMILFGVVAGVSIVKLFLGGIVPGILIGVGLMIVWYFHAKKMGYKAVGHRQTRAEMMTAVKEAGWALMLPIIILGGIVSGVYTPTEAAVVAVVYAFFIGMFVYKELKISQMPEILVMSGKGTAIVLLVCGAATAAGYMITTAQVPLMLLRTLNELAGGNVLLAMFWINVLLLIVGCVMDLTPALLILAPMLLPVAESYGLDPVYFGVVMCVNLCVGLITPPVGTVLYVGCGLSKISMGQITKPLLPFIGVMITVLLLITYIPSLVTFIPNLFTN
ncbi:MAG: putative transporter [Firmicutes bacterium]|nr:putative transporter [Bacillota bacterium]